LAGLGLFSGIEQWQPMGKNIQEIARVCGVSTATVSRVLNNKPDVSDGVRQRVLDTLREFNFTPKLTVNRTNILGVTIEYRHALSSPYISTILEAVEDTAYEAGYDVLILRNERLRQVKSHFGQFLRRKMISGLIVILSRINDSFLAEIAQDDFPHVVVGNRPAETDHYIDSDWYGGVKEATRHLVSLGHSAIAFIQPGLNAYFDHRERLRGYLDGLKEAGIVPRHEMIVDGDRGTSSPLEFGYEAANTLLGQFLDVTAVMTVNEAVGGVIEALRAHNLSVPEDMSIITFDDSVERAHFYPTLSVIAQDASTLGRLAAKEVISRIETPEANVVPIKMILPTKLIIRQTTDLNKLVKGLM